MALIDVQRRLTEVGRIRLGDKGSRGQPQRLTKFRLTSASRSTLEAAAALYGGTVRQWSGAPDEGYWELYSETDEIDILIPPTLAAYSQFYELWAGGGCKRRCDGRTEMLSGEPCMCDPDARECDVVTRVNVMLPRIPGLGVWRLDTGGWNAAATLPTTLDLLAAMGRTDFVPAVLRLEQRTAKRTDDKGKSQTRHFVVPVIDLMMTPGELTGVQVTAPPAPAQLGPVNRRERVARPDLPAIEAPADTPPVRTVERPAFGSPPEILDAPMPSMDEIVAEALDEVPPADPDAERAFKRAAKAAGITAEAIAVAARKTWGAIPSSAYSARHWAGLADALGIAIQ